MNRKILIIGGTRFVGPSLIKNLLNSKDKITVFSRGNNYNNSIDKRVKRIFGDRDVESDLNKLDGKSYDVVYDMCCYNLEQIKKLIPHIKTTHLVFFSTSAVYKKPIFFPLKENDVTGEWNSFGDYGVNKRSVEKYLLKKGVETGFKITIIRPVYILGENNYFDRENYYFSRLLKNEPILMPGCGQALIQFCFLEDVATALYAIPLNQKKQTEIVNLGSDEYISVIGFINLCAKISQKTPRIMQLNMAELGLDEERFYDNLYPFPNVSLILDNTIAKKVYHISFTPLNSGLKNIYRNWKHTWNGEVIKSEKEMELLKMPISP